MHQNPCFSLLILHDNSFDSQGSKINKNDIFLRFDIQNYITNIQKYRTELQNKHTDIQRNCRTSNMTKNVGKKCVIEKE